ncbi:MAG: translation initiation factor IF-2 [Ruminococcaceae bacterium]|nr:translation initiation factor IF-2 [Oscillospiraceae bacterium]
MKYKLQDVAKDLGIDKSELIELLDKAFPSDTQRKGQSSLTSDEVGYVLEKYTKKHEVDDVMKAFVTTRDIKTEKPAEPEKKSSKKKVAAKKDEAPEEQPEKPEKSGKPEKPVKTVRSEVQSDVKEDAEPVKAEKKPEVKEETVKTEPAKTEPVKEETKPEPVKTESAKPESVKPEPVKEDVKPELVKPEQKKPENGRNDQPKQNRPENRDNKDNRPNRDNRDGRDNKPRDNRENRDNKPRDNRDNRDNRQRDNRDNKDSRNNAPKPQQKPAAAKAVIDSSKIKVNTPPMQKQKGEAVQRGEQVRKTVDTRGSYVELDKYNERYESIAPASKMNNDNFRSKQKINQKSQQKGKQYGKQRETEAQKLKRLELERARKQQLKVQIPDEIVVGELATRLKVTATEVIKKLFNLGVMANINETIDFDTASLVAEELGAKVEKEVIITIEERLFEDAEDAPESLKPRSPVVVVMGHVDHGKTSILDYIRKANVQTTEAGGITQHIGAYRVNLGDRDITFLDTPGHEAFTSMRARGAMITDIAILVVAADDGIMPQTVEAINHAKAAGVQIIVAMNKMDKEGANPEKVKEELTKYDLVCEDWGGNIICVPVSAKTGMGMDTLLEMVGLTADVMELKANPDRLAKGAVIEARLDKSRGPIATLLVQNGTLHTGDILIAGTSVGRVRVMRDDKGRTVTEAGPSVPVEIMGLSEVPSAGDTFAAVEDEKLARELVEKRKHEAKEEQFKSYQKVTLDNLFSSIEQGEVKELPIIVKGDVQGSVEAVKQSLEKITNEEVRVRVIHGGVGAVSESDIMLAMASGAIIVGFNVRPHPSAEESAKENGVEVRLYRVIYDAIEDITAAMKGMLAPKFREVQLGRVEVRQIYKITGVGVVAGSYVLDGKVARSGQVRIVRDGIIVGDDHIAGLQRFKDSVKEVAAGYECGISLEKFTDIKEGDIFEAYMMEEYQE